MPNDKTVTVYFPPEVRKMIARARADERQRIRKAFDNPPFPRVRGQRTMEWRLLGMLAALREEEDKNDVD